jgi:hypothetical protein
MVRRRVGMRVRVPLAAFHAAQRADDRMQRHEVRDGDREQERRRHERADRAGDVVKRGEALAQPEGRGRDGGRRDDHDGRVPEREHQPDGQRTPAFVHQLARHVVDRGDVVGVDRVAQPERVGEHAGAHQRGLAAEHGDGPAPGGQVERRERREQQDELAARAACATAGAGQDGRGHDDRRRAAGTRAAARGAAR